jgi:hypothetical protein
MDDKERLKKIRLLNEMLADYLDKCEMDEAEEETTPGKGKGKEK